MADDGATPKEILFEACRRNNTTLLTEVLSSPPLSSKAAEIAQFLNTSTNALGSTALHVAAASGSYEILDQILDQEGVEIDGQETRDGDTPLHRAARYCNGLSPEEWTREGKALFELLIDAGCDPRIRNKNKVTPQALLDPRNDACRNVLRKAEMTLMAGDDIVRDDDDGVEDGGSESD